MALSTSKANATNEEFLPIQLQDKIGQLREGFGDVDVRVRSFVKERPFATVFGALAAGYFLGRLIARS